MLDVLANDSDADGDVLEILSIGAPALGVASLQAGKVIYTSAATFTGDETRSRVLFTIEHEALGRAELFVVDVTGGDIVRLNTDLPEGGTVFPDFRVTSEGRRVIYRASQTSVTEVELFSVAL